MVVSSSEARRKFADEIRDAADIASGAIIEALATMPRERFLPPGPWFVRGIADVGRPPRVTEDGDPSRIYQDVSVAIDSARNLYNGQPSLIACWIDALKLGPGHRVVHVGCGTGYFTALIGHVVGPDGCVQGFDIESDLVVRARENLSDQPWVEIRHGNGTTGLLRDANGVLVHAGATHVLDAWLDALSDGGRLLVPLTVEFPGMPGGIGKGMMLLVTRRRGEWRVQAYGATPVAIYSLKEIRDPQAAVTLSQAFVTGAVMRIGRVRRDRHEPTASCLVHNPTTCLSV